MNINSTTNTPYSLLKNKHLARDNSQDITSLPRTSAGWHVYRYWIMNSR